ncbi:MAG: hypothetical protein WB816_16320 [Methylocystis sp.]
MTFNPTKLASRPVGVVLAMKILLCLLAADVGLVAAKALLSHGGEMVAAVATRAVEPGARPAFTAQVAPVKRECRHVLVEIDEGYGVSSHVTREVCREVM